MSCDFVLFTCDGGHLVYKVLIQYLVSWFVAGPNKHDNLSVSSPSRKLSHADAAAKKEADAKRAADATAAERAAPVPTSQPMSMLIIHSYGAQTDDQINLVAGEYIYGVKMGDDGWWSGTTMDGKTGWFPTDCVTARSDS